MKTDHYMPYANCRSKIIFYRKFQILDVIPGSAFEGPSLVLGYIAENRKQIWPISHYRREKHNKATCPSSVFVDLICCCNKNLFSLCTFSLCTVGKFNECIKRVYTTYCHAKKKHRIPEASRFVKRCVLTDSFRTNACVTE